MSKNGKHGKYYHKSTPASQQPPKAESDEYLDAWDRDVGFFSKSSLNPINSYAPCYHTHPPLKLPGTKLVIYGGSCSSPIHRDADVYVGLETGMAQPTKPWLGGVCAMFKIVDRQPPDSPEEFKKMIDWLCNQLHAGKKVHVGCIGGHGRTGLVFSALVSKFGEMDAITYVRENYCKKAVETTAQVDFLHKHFGITKVVGSKAHTDYKAPTQKSMLDDGYDLPDQQNPKTSTTRTTSSTVGSYRGNYEKHGQRDQHVIASSGMGREAIASGQPTMHTRSKVGYGGDARSEMDDRIGVLVTPVEAKTALWPKTVRA